MNYILFEDSKTTNLKPFSLNHASFEMRCGIYSNIERVHNLLSTDDKLYLIVRPEIEAMIRERFPQLTINPEIIPSGLMLNGATIWNKDLIDEFETDKSYSCSGSLVSINRSISTDLDQFQTLLVDSIQVTMDIQVIHINYIWDLIFNISNILKNDLNGNDEFLAYSSCNPTLDDARNEDTYNFHS